MFGYVKIEELQAERAARIKAERAQAAAVAQAQALADQATRDEEQIAQLTSLLDRERQRHAAEIKDVLDRFVPKAVQAQGEDGPPARFTADQIRNRPAVNKRDMLVRKHEVQQREMEERTDEERAEYLRRHSKLTPDESARMDTLLGVLVTEEKEEQKAEVNPND